MHGAAKALRSQMSQAVLLKGGHLPGTQDIVDVYCDASGTREILHPRLALEGHGTGCTLASAITANLCLGMELHAACVAASDYVHAALLGSYRPGHGDVVVLDHFGAATAR